MAPRRIDVSTKRCGACLGSGKNTHGETCLGCGGVALPVRQQGSDWSTALPAVGGPIGVLDEAQRLIKRTKDIDDHTLAEDIRAGWHVYKQYRGKPSSPSDLVSPVQSRVKLLEVYDKQRNHWVPVVRPKEIQIIADQSDAFGPLFEGGGLAMGGSAKMNYGFEARWEVQTMGTRCGGDLLEAYGHKTSPTYVGLELQGTGKDDRIEMAVTSVEHRVTMGMGADLDEVWMRFQVSDFETMRPRTGGGPASTQVVPSRVGRRISSPRPPGSPVFADMPTPAPIPYALITSSMACHVCGDAAYTRNGRGQPEHLTCGAWGADA
jgi:hypothetical protein